MNALALLPIAALLAGGPAQKQYERRTPVRSLDEVPVGRYEPLRRPGAAITLERRGDVLLLRGYGPEASRLELQPDGGFRVPLHYRAWIVRRGPAVWLWVMYCYELRVYRHIARPPRR